MQKIDIAKIASGNFLLAALTPPDYLMAIPHLKLITPQSGVVLAEQHSVVDTVYFPLSGMISLVNAMESGEAIELATVGHEAAVGIFEALGHRPAFARAVIQVSGTMLAMKADFFRQFAAQSARLRELAICYEDALLAQLSQTAACNALHPLDKRLARWLLQTSDRIDSKTLSLTQDFVAQMLGVSRTTVTLLAGRLQQAGIIEYSRGRIQILDRTKLEASSCECYRVINNRIARAYRSSAARNTAQHSTAQ